MDKNGLLWIGTTNGLNSYDGYRVKNYFSRDHPGLLNDKIIRMVCDDDNRIWIQCEGGGLTLLDEERQFRPVVLPDQIKDEGVAYLLPFTKNPSFISKGVLYSLVNELNLQFEPVKMTPEPLLGNTFERINKWDEDRLVFSGNNLLFLLNMNERKITAIAEVPEIVAAAKLTDDLAIVTSAGAAKLSKVSFAEGKVIQEYSQIKDQHGELLHRFPGSVMPVEDHQFLISSPSAGLYLFDSQRETLRRYQHNVLDFRSISTNHTSYIFSAQNGFYFIATLGLGLNYFKQNSQQAKIQTTFVDSLTGLIYNGHIASIAEDSKENTWLGGSKTLIKWTRSTGVTHLHTLGSSPEQDQWGGIKTIFIDKADRKWVGFSNGLVIFDKNLNPLTYLTRESGLPDNVVNQIVESPGGSLWVCTKKGIGIIDPATLRVNTPSVSSALREVQNKNCNTVWFRSENEVWIGTWEGAFVIDLTSGEVKSYTTQNGLLFNEVIGFEEDDQRNIYLATRYGFHILTPDKPIVSFEYVNNTWPVDCHSLIKDRRGTIWFANHDFLAAYSPASKRFQVFDEKTGINPTDFRFYAAHTTKKGELIFGSNRGVTYFRPENVRVPELPLSALIHEMETTEGSHFPVPGTTTKLPFHANTVSFSFSAINLLRGKNLFYQYRLKGSDRNWTKTTSGQRITYNNLSPGHYVFAVKVSGDGINWVHASNPVSLAILMPWWQQRWFIALSALIIGAISLVVFTRRNYRARQNRENLETQKAINYLATSIYEKSTVEDILWDVAKNCIGRLQFEDCVIYLVDEKRNLLVQKAAWGPKTTEENKIINPIEIPIGKGIVGSVAKTGIAEIISDTSKDERYIIDDAVRLSEITVPIIYDGKVLGIIDSEHTKKGFFTDKHLSILTTISSLCANKMVRAKAEQEKQEAQLATLRHEREAVEAQLKSLRLQMNPHFLFNSLNSIQQMILAGEDRAATRYLSKFSRLLRLVLLHSDKERITLKEELETLNLYVELESLRFKDSFRYDIKCDERIDPEEIKIPVMLIQPFVENAIWHGLLPKPGDRRLSVLFSEDTAENMICTIEDNGVGREAASKITNDNHTQKGISVAEERLKTYNTHNGQNSKIWVEDLKDSEGNATGTRVVLVLGGEWQ